MGIFDGILICSDWDGTLFDGNTVPKQNIDAISYFIDNGGHFTICSGRQPSYIKKLTETVPTSTYAVALNGAVILDFKSGDVLQKGFVDDEAYVILDAMIESGAELDAIAMIEEDAEMFTWYTTNEYLSQKEKIKKTKMHDIVMRASTEDAAIALTERANKFISGKKDCNYSVQRSFDIGVEILRLDLTKGAAARRVADRVGAKTLIGVGDYENDIALIKEADIGYAVENAVASLKSAADRITVNASNGAIAKIIEELEADIRLQRY